MQQLRTYLYTFVLTAISMLPANGYAQDNKTPAPLESDSIQLFRGLSVSYNLAGTVIRMVSEYGEIEGALRANLKDRYFPVFEMGLGLAKHTDDPITNIEAKTTAPFFRIGCDLNVSKNKHDDYRVMFGMRYGFTHFKQEAYGMITDPYWGGVTEYGSEVSCSYHWAEMLLSLDARIWGPLRLGWSLRYKREIGHSSDAPGQNIWYIPGYGKNGNKLGATFNVTFELGKKNRKTNL